MSAPENGTIAHNNRQTYIKTKDYSPCKKSVAIYNPYVSWLSQLMDSIVSWEIAVVFCPLCMLRLVLRWHSILILTSSSSSTPWPSCLSSSFSSSPSSFISQTDFRTDWHSFYIIWYYILLHRDPSSFIIPEMAYWCQATSVMVTLVMVLVQAIILWYQKQNQKPKTKNTTKWN